MAPPKDTLMLERGAAAGASRFDQSTFNGRLSTILDMIDPRTLLIGGLFMSKKDPDPCKLDSSLMGLCVLSDEELKRCQAPFPLPHQTA